MNLEKAITMLPDLLDHFLISTTQATATAGVAFTNNVIVTAYDQWDNVKTDYVGNVYFTSTDGQAVLPYVLASQYSFTVLDAGAHTFTASGFNLRTTGNQTITITDGSISDTTGNIAVGPGILGSFTVTGEPSEATAGTPFATPANDIVVTAKDAYGNTKTNYTGSVWFSSSDLNENVALPATEASKYTFTTGGGSDNGVHTFAGSGFTLITANQNQTLTLTDGAGAGADVNKTIYINPTVIDHFGLADYPEAGGTEFATAGYDFATAGGDGSPYDVVVTAYDEFENIKTDFTGVVWFTVDDGVVSTFTYNSDSNYYTFTENGGSPRDEKSDEYDNGVHIFNASDFQIDTAGQSLNFYVDSTGDLESQFSVYIRPAGTASVDISIAPPLSTKLVDTELTESVTVTLYDTAGNLKTEFVGEVWFTSSDAMANIPYTE